jgi:hypothetical protein
LSLAREGQRRRIPRVKGGCGGIGSLCRDRLLDELVETLTTSAMSIHRTNVRFDFHLFGMMP